jgi:hypothetical protein
LALFLAAFPVLGNTLSLPAAGASGSVFARCFPDEPCTPEEFGAAQDNFSFGGDGSGQATINGPAGVTSDGAQVQTTFDFGGNGIDENVNLEVSAFADLTIEAESGGSLQAADSFDHPFSVDTPSVLQLIGCAQFEGGPGIGLQLTGPGGTLFSGGPDVNQYFDLQPGFYELSGYVDIDEEFVGGFFEPPTIPGFGDLSVSAEIVPEPRWISFLAALLLPFFLGLRRIARG